MDDPSSKVGCNINIDSELTNLPFPEEFNPEAHLISNMITPPSIPDGGFGWFCVLGTFLINFVIDGTNGSIGIFLPAMKEHYGTTTQQNSLVLSMLILFIYVMSPVAAVLLDKVSSRALVLSLGLLGTASFIGSYFVSSVSLLSLTFGVLPGASFSICVMASQVMISLYFDKRRAMAYSITGIGSGVGAILVPFLANYVVAHHGFKALFLFLAGISSLLVISGPCFVPLELTDERGNRIAEQMVTSAGVADESALYMREVRGASIDVGAGSSRNSSLEDLVSIRRSSQLIHMVDTLPKAPSRVRFNLKEKSQNLKENLSLMTLTKRSTMVIFKPRIKRGDSTVMDLSNIYNVLSSKPDYVPTSKARDLKNLNNENSFYDEAFRCYTGNASFSGLLLRINDVIERTKVRKKSMKIFSHSEGDIFRLKYGHKYNFITQNPFIDKRTLAFLKKWIHDLMVKPMNRADIFYKGSRKQLVDLGLIHHEPDIQNIIHVPRMERDATFWGRFSHIFSIIADLSVLRIPQLVFYIVSISLFSWAAYVPMLFIVSFAIPFSPHATWLPSVIGAGTVLGQLMCGIGVSYCGVSARAISEVSFYLAGAFTAVIAALEGHFAPIVVVCLFFGLTYGVLMTTWQSILCELVGIRRLSASLSFYLLFRGISIFVGIYSSGALSAQIGIRNTIYFAASILALSALVQSLMRIQFRAHSNIY